MFRHIRSKLIAAFAVPLAILVAVAGLGIVSSLNQISKVNKEAALASAAVVPGGLVQDLQTERDYSVLDIFGAAAGLPSPLAGLNPTLGGLSQSPMQIMLTTDMAAKNFQAVVGHAGALAEESYGPALAALGQLPQARAAWLRVRNGARHIADFRSLAQAADQGYTAIIDALIAGTASVPQHLSDATLRSGVEAMYSSLEGTEAQWQALDDLSQAAWSTGTSEAANVSAASQAWGAEQTWVNQLRSLAAGPYAAAVATLTGSPASTSVGDQSPVAVALQQVMTSLQLRLGNGVLPSGHSLIPPLTSVFDAFSAPAGGVTGSAPARSTASVTTAALGQRQIAAIVRSRARALHYGALEQLALFCLVGALGAVAGLVLVVRVSRSVSRPLVNLSRQAEELAQVTLPATVKSILEQSSTSEAPDIPTVQVEGRDEVAEMGRALDAVGKTAVELAAGQAALRRNLAEAFVNLGRRNQNLVTRQLEYISEIELKEADPESLEELFRLDHLATRMRRNAESLLILAGSGPARQWSAAVPAMDVARAASAEVEDYKRLRLHHFDQAQISGSVTTDLVHILAELIENALSFSPPGSAVDLYGRFLEGGYVIVIVDSGIGMSPEDLDLANRRLEGEDPSEEVPGRYLGHFVAGRLAARHGIAISLQASHSGGLVARVKVPSELIEDPVADLSAMAEIRASAPDQGRAPAPRPTSQRPATASASYASAPSMPTVPSPVPQAKRPVDPFAPAAPAVPPVVPAVPVTASPPSAAVKPTEPTVASAERMAPAAGPTAPAAPSAPAAPPEASAPGTVWAPKPQPSTSVEVSFAGLQPQGAQTNTVQLPAPARPALNLGILSALAATPTAGQDELEARAPAPAAQYASDVATTVDTTDAGSADGGLRKLAKRVPGASLPDEDNSLRRETPTSTISNPAGLTGALSQYLSAMSSERPEKENNA